MLPPEEAEHLTRVLRLGTGAAIRVFNGSGEEFESVVEATSKEAVQVRLGQPRDPAPEALLQVTLAQAVLKGDKMDDVIRDAVMIGAKAILTAACIPGTLRKLVVNCKTFAPHCASRAQTSR